MMYLYFVKIEPGFTNMRTRTGEKLVGWWGPDPRTPPGLTPLNKLS